MLPFVLSRIPKTFFGSGAQKHIFDIVLQEKCSSLLLITGGNSYIRTPYYDQLIEGLNKLKVKCIEARVTHEPSPELVDDITIMAKQEKIEMVLAIGGGSVLDTGKAVSAMMKVSGSVKDYLEGVGTREHDGSKVTIIAVPTTSGTGSEATKNAVLSNVGEKGFKKSLRHDHFVPDYALLDPQLTLSCPLSVTAFSGMDALNQLIEGFLSVKANPFTDELAFSGIKKALHALEPLCLGSLEDIELRGEMAYAAYLSGIVLANAGLGYVHGFAGVIGGLMDIPHGVVCGKLNARVFEVIARKIIDNKEAYAQTYNKLLVLGELVNGDSKYDMKKIQAVVQKLYEIEECAKLPPFSSYGLSPDMIQKAISLTSGKESPIEISLQELKQILTP